MLRVDLTRASGRAIGARYGVEFTPTYLVFDARGSLVSTARLGDGAALARELRALVSR